MGTTMKNLNQDVVRGLLVPSVEVEEQNEVVRRVEALFALADKIEQRVQAATARAEKITQAILARAFRGELVPTEAELARREGRSYEPAAVLLARMKKGAVVRAGWLGIQPAPAGDSADGVVVSKVNPGSPAEKAGCKRRT